MSEALDDLDLTEDEQKELNNEAPTNEAETNEAETNETPQEAEAEDTNANVETNIDSDYENFKNRWAKKTPDEIKISDILSAVEEKVKTIGCQKHSKKGCNGKSAKCITHNLWDELETHINVFFQEKKLGDLINKNENRL